MAQLPRLEHHRLRSPQHIRLLRVQQATDLNDSIICWLEEWDPTDPQCPQYEALSWRWGEKNKMEEITIRRAYRDDQDTEPAETNSGRSRRSSAYTFEVRETLYNALKALRKGDTDRVLWVDNICINQLDIDEKDHQVSRMSVIYGNANNVCIWLGDVGDRSDEALLFIRDRLSKPYQLYTHCTESKYLRDWVALKSLMKRPWFYRRWIVQEVALATRATITCGLQSIPWEEFKSATSIMVHSQELLTTLVKNSDQEIKQYNLNEHEIDFSEVPTLGAAQLVEVTDRLFKRNAGNQLQLISSLEEVVAWLPMFTTTNPRDVVYPLLALARDTQPSVDFLTNSAHEGRPDNRTRAGLRMLAAWSARSSRERYEIKYNQPIVDVYQQFIAFAMRKNQNPSRTLDIICRPFAKEYGPIEDAPEPRPPGYSYIPLPSWIPSINKLPWVNQQQAADNEQPYFKYERERGDPFVSVPGLISYYSAADLREYENIDTNFRKRRDHYSLFVKGFVLDEVGATTEHISENGRVTDDWIKLAYATGRADDRVAFTRTLVADRGLRGGIAPAFYAATLVYALDKVDPYGSLRPFNQKKDTKSSQVIEVMNHVSNTISGRRLIRTKHFQLLGLAPTNVREGDLICILYGCSVPVILRRGEEKNLVNDEEDDYIHECRLRATRLARRWLSRRRRNRPAQTDVETGPEPSSNSQQSQTAAPRATGLSTTSIGHDVFHSQSPIRPSPSPILTSSPTTIDDASRRQSQQKTSATTRRIAPDLAPIMSRASILCVSALAASRLLGNSVLACSIVLLCSTHYITDITTGSRIDPAHILVFITSPFFVVVLVSGIIPLLASTIISATVFLLYPQLLPKHYRTLIPWHNERQLTFETSPSVDDTRAAPSGTESSLNRNTRPGSEEPEQPSLHAQTTSSRAIAENVAASNTSQIARTPGIRSSPQRRSTSTTHSRTINGRHPSSRVDSRTNGFAEPDVSSSQRPTTRDEPFATRLPTRRDRTTGVSRAQTMPASHSRDDNISTTSPNAQSGLGTSGEQVHRRREYETERYAFTLIGESYIDTMMTGQAIAKQNESMSTPNRMETVTFELR